MPSLDHLLGEIGVDGPEHRLQAIACNDGRLAWPEGWWAVSDDQFAYVAFFQFESDARAFRLYLVNLRQNAPGGCARYATTDAATDADEAAMFTTMASLSQERR